MADLYPPPHVTNISLDDLNRSLGASLLLSDMYTAETYDRLQALLSRAIAAAAAGDLATYQDARSQFRVLGRPEGHDEHLAHRIVQWFAEYYWAEQFRRSASRALSKIAEDSGGAPGLGNSRR